MHPNQTHHIGPTPAHAHPGPLEASPGKQQGLTTLMSQDSIQHYVQDAEKENQEERRRLQLQDSERKQFLSQ